MSFLLFAALIACGTSSAPEQAATPQVEAPPVPPQAPPVAPEADVAALQAALASGATLIDVRTPEEFAAGHVPGARNLPMDQLEAQSAQLGPPGTELYVICQSGGRSARASANLGARGFRAINVVGGTSAWIAAGYPVE